MNILENQLHGLYYVSLNSVAMQPASIKAFSIMRSILSVSPRITWAFWSTVINGSTPYFSRKMCSKAMIVQMPECNISGSVKGSYV